MVNMDPDEVLQECSDDEEFKSGIDTRNYWSPSAEDVAELYEKMTGSKFLELSWQCPGRSGPDDEKLLQEVNTEPAAKQEEPDVKTEFDNFDDEDKPTLRPTLKSTPKGSAKKKTTSLASILTNMERTRYIEELGSEGRRLLQQFHATKPITSTPDSINQSIDRVLENQAALDQTSEEQQSKEEVKSDALELPEASTPTASATATDNRSTPPPAPPPDDPNPEPSSDVKEVAPLSSTSSAPEAESTSTSSTAVPTEDSSTTPNN